MDNAPKVGGEVVVGSQVAHAIGGGWKPLAHRIMRQGGGWKPISASDNAPKGGGGWN